MKIRNEPNINSWDLYQLARAIIQNRNGGDDELNTICPILNEALEHTEKSERSRPILPAKQVRPGHNALQVAMVVVTEMHLDLSAALAAILLPAFLADAVSEQTVAKKFGPKVAEILVESKLLRSCKIQETTIQNYPSRPDVHSAHVVALLLTVANIVRLHASGVLLEHELLECTGPSSRLLPQLQYFYIPLCHRMHLYEVQAKLADFWLKHTDTLSYYFITAKLGMTKLQRKQKLEVISEEIRTFLDSHRVDFVMKTRIKSVYSIWRKIQKLNVNFERIYDLSAIRIILRCTKQQTVEEEKILCWQVFSLLSQLYTPMYDIMRDWISVPRPNGYESLHITLQTPENGLFEAQIRTERMDYAAEYGEAAHWKYKYSS